MKQRSNHRQRSPIQKRCLLICVAAHISTSLIAGESRTWTRADGRGKFTATFQAATRDRVQLVPAGRQQPIWLTRNVLSASDITYVNAQQQRLAPHGSLSAVASQTLNNRMQTVAAELGLPTFKGLPLHVTGSMLSDRKATAAYRDAWARFSDRISLTVRYDFLGLESFMPGQPRPQSRRALRNNPAAEKAAYRLKTIAPQFILNHLPLTETQRYVNLYNSRGKYTVKTSDPWKAESPVATTNAMLDFRRRNLNSINAMKLKFPLRIAVSYPAIVSGYDRTLNCFPLSIHERPLERNFELPTPKSSHYSSNNVQIPVQPFLQPDRWQTSVENAQRLLRSYPRRSDGSGTVYLVHVLRVDSVSGARFSPQGDLPLTAVVESTQLYADSELTRAVGAYDVTLPTESIQQVPLVDDETLHSVMQAGETLATAALLSNVTERSFHTEVWPELWREQWRTEYAEHERQRQHRKRRIDLASQHARSLANQGPGEPGFQASAELLKSTSKDRPYFAAIAKENRRYQDPEQVQLESYRQYMRRKGHSLKTIVVRAKFERDGFGPVLQIGNDQTLQVRQTSVTNGGRSFQQYVELSGGHNDDWTDEYLRRIPLTGPSRETRKPLLGMTVTVDEIVRQLPKAVRQQILTAPQDSYAELVVNIENCSLHPRQASSEWFVIGGRPQTIRIWQRDRQVENSTNTRWQDSMKLIGQHTIQATAEAGTSITSGDKLEGTVPLSPATMLLLAAARCEDFSAAYVDQLMLRRYRHEADLRRDSGDNSYGVLQECGAFFTASEKPPKTQTVRDSRREAFLKWLNDASCRLPESFSIRLDNFTFMPEHAQQASLSPAIFREASVPSTLRRDWRLIDRGADRNIGDKLAYSQADYEQRQGLAESELSRGVIWDYETYLHHVALAPADVHLGGEYSAYTIPDLDGKTISKRRNSQPRFNDFGIPLSTTSDDRPIHPVLRLDAEIWLPENPVMDDVVDRKLTIELTFGVKACHIKNAPPAHAWQSANRALLGADEENESTYVDQGDYLIFDICVTGAAIVDSKTGEVVMKLRCAPYRTVPPIKPPTQPALS